jgi:hypothetical protein
MTPEDYIRKEMQGWAAEIKGWIPPEHGFVLLVFPYGPGGIMQYVANAERLDVVQAMREFIAMVDKETFATDQEDQGKEGFDAWWEIQLKRASYGATPKELAYDAFVAGMIWSHED